MSAQANKNVFPFLGVSFDAATAANDKYNTPAGFEHTLGVLQAIQYKTAKFRAHNNSDAAITVRLKEGANTVASLALAANAAGLAEIDLAGISGAAKLTVAVDVTTVGTGTGTAPAFLDVEQPIQVSRC